MITVRGFAERRWDRSGLLQLFWEKSASSHRCSNHFAISPVVSVRSVHLGELDFMASLEKDVQVTPNIRRSEPMQVGSLGRFSGGGRRSSTSGEHRLQPYSRKKPRAKPKPTVEPPLFFLPSSYEEPCEISVAMSSRSCPNQSSEVLTFSHPHSPRGEQDRDEPDSPHTPDSAGTSPVYSTGFATSPTIFSLLQQRQVLEQTSGRTTQRSSIDSDSARPSRSVSSHDNLRDIVSSLSEQFHDISFDSKCASDRLSPRAPISQSHLCHSTGSLSALSSDEDLQFEIEFSSTGSSPPKTHHHT
eukprot:g1357.t1